MLAVCAACYTLAVQQTTTLFAATDHAYDNDSGRLLHKKRRSCCTPPFFVALQINQEEGFTLLLWAKYSSPPVSAM